MNVLEKSNSTRLKYYPIELLLITVMYAHLRTHSYYSFLEGLPSPVALAQAASKAGMGYLGLTDRNALTGAVEFYEGCKAIGIKPLIGLELVVAAPPGFAGLHRENSSGDLALFAMDMRGWSNLCRLLSTSEDKTGQATRKPIAFDRLVEHSESLVCLSGGVRGLGYALLRRGQEAECARLFQQLAEVFSDRFYVELQIHTPEDKHLASRLATIAQDLDLKTIATHGVYFLAPEEHALQKTLTAMRMNQAIDDIPAKHVAPGDGYFKSMKEVEAAFDGLPRALEGSLEAAERCQLELPLDTPHYPEYPLPEGVDEKTLLREKAERGARKLYGALSPEIKARLDHELGVIDRRGYNALFLIMEEIVRFVKDQGIPMSSRGSAASSLVAHCLGITTPDPIKLNLYFERFLNPARMTPPDIDTDLCSRRRDEVIKFVFERFGQDHVAMVCTINRFRKRSALREVAKAYGLSPGEVNALVENIPQRGWGPPSGDDEGESPYAVLSGKFTSPLYQQIFRDAIAILGYPHHLSIHPGGIVIAPGQITDLLPVQMAAKGVMMTQFDLDTISRLCMIKIDLLGIRGLTVLGDVVENAVKHGLHKARKPVEIFDAIPEDDPETTILLQQGNTIGCFQIESPGMRATLKEIQASDMTDIMVALALYRPGPLTGGLKDSFVRRYRGEEEVVHLHPALTSILKETHGVILYQEQVLRIANEMAGLDLIDADLLRRAMSHFDPGNLMQSLKERFIIGAGVRSDVPEDVAEKIWDMMAAFAGYGFPKAHAASYALVAWRSAWCKAHFPALFMAAVLANWGGYYHQRVYLNEARWLGLAIRPPHVNYSRKEFSVRYEKSEPILYMGLDQVRDLSKRSQARILKYRPFHSFENFLARVDPRHVEAENLVRAGAFEGYGTIPGLLRQLQRASWREKQLQLFSYADEEIEDWPLAEKVASQEAVLGVSVIASRFELFAQQIKEADALSTVEAGARRGEYVRVVGLRQTWRRLRTERGAFYMMGIEDQDGYLDVLISSDVYRQYKQDIQGPGPYIVEGEVRLNRDFGEPVVHANKIWRLKLGDRA